MKHSGLLKFIVMTVLIVFLVACGGSSDSADTLDIDRPAPPPEYAGKTNPLADDPGMIQEGKRVYTVNCSSCHGVGALGDGPAAVSLKPKPKPLALEMKMLGDDYLFWRISEGGAFSPFFSAMPAWKRALSEDEIWQAIAYLHTLQP